jgi:hypothetical protein
MPDMLTLIWFDEAEQAVGLEGLKQVLVYYEGFVGIYILL